MESFHCQSAEYVTIVFYLLSTCNYSSCVIANGKPDDVTFGAQSWFYRRLDVLERH